MQDKQKKLLVIGVGMACAPVVSAIDTLNPDAVYFFCSEQTRKLVDGSGKVCKKDYRSEQPELLNILKQRQDGRELPYDVAQLENPDSLKKCTEHALSVFKQIKKDYAGYDVIVDVTPGTKTMTVALVNASMVIPNAKIVVTTANRLPENEYQVALGTEKHMPIPAGMIMFSFHTRMIEQFIGKYDYSAAVDYIRQLMNSNSGLDDWMIEQLNRYDNWCRTFAAWDKFDHEKAGSLLRYSDDSEHGGYQEYLNKILSQRCLLESPEVSINDFSIEGSAEIVWDMLYNTHRCAINLRFDDAVARLYRSLEMLMQLRLKTQYDIHTAKVRPDQLSAELCARYGIGEKGGKIDLVRGYDLLVDLNDRLGAAWNENRSRLIDMLGHRNQSILAHGVKTVDASMYEEVDKVIGSFVRSQLETHFGAKNISLQLPRLFNRPAGNDAKQGEPAHA